MAIESNIVCSYISVSIFYNRREWHNLIDTIIEPFLISQSQKKRIEKYYLFFSLTRGEHVKLVYKVPGSRKPYYQLSKLKYLLECNPSKGKARKMAFGRLFMDYPNNSLDIVKTECIGYYFHDQDLDIVRRNISTSMLKAFAAEIDDEQLFTFVVYMKLAMIKAIYADFDLAYSAVVDLVNSFDNGNDAQKCEDLSQSGPSSRLTEVLALNENILSELIHDLWFKFNYESKLKWLKVWEENFTSYSNKGNFKLSYRLASNLIYEHIGLISYISLTFTSQLILQGFEVFKKCQKPEP